MKQSFNENWICYKTGDKENAFAVTLPHDAMQLYERSETSAGGVNTGWYEAQDYTYEKTFILPEKAKDEKVILEFEGVYRKATVYLNGEKVAYHSYGYLGFYVDATKYVKRYFHINYGWGESYNGYYLYIPQSDNYDQDLRWEGTSRTFPYQMKAFSVWQTKNE